MEVLEPDLHRTNIDTEFFEAREKVEQVMGCKCQLCRFGIVRCEAEGPERQGGCERAGCRG
jgi:hypothetical protein